GVDSALRSHVGRDAGGANSDLLSTSRERGLPNRGMPQDNTKHARPPGNILFIGCGSIGQGTLPLLLRHLDIDASQLAIITSDERGSQVANEYGVRFIRQPLEEGNHRQVLDPWVRQDSFVVNLSVEVASTALIE